MTARNPNLFRLARTRVVAGFLVALAAWTLETQAADAPPFQNFAGTFSRDSRVEISGGSDATGGKCKLRFTIGPEGETARLKIAGEVTIDGARRTFSNIVALRREGRAAVSNLAPGIDDGYSTEDGTFTISPRSIHANFTFVFGTNTGTATVFLRLKKRPRGTQILVTQTLSSTALTDPITWNFKAFSRN